jgi:hypothetical protein
VTVHPSRRPGAGALTPGRVIRHAVAMLRHGFWRVAGVALIVFIPPPLLSELAEEFAIDVQPRDDPVLWALLAAAVVLVVILKLIGPVLYAGYLDEAVGHGYVHGSKRTLRDVIRSLPLVRLLLADVILVTAVSLGLVLLVVPGIVIGTLFGLVGPVIVQERRTLVDAFRRTYRISLPAWRLIILLVMVPIGIEHAVAETVLERAHEIHPIAEVIAEWALAVSVGAGVGLLEVAMAMELMARMPEPRIAAPERPDVATPERPEVATPERPEAAAWGSDRRAVGDG